MAKDWHFKTHGMTNTAMYRLWWGMRSRCEHPKTRGYSQYGALGITVCDRWKQFENFLADMGERPDGMTLGRVDSAKGYSPENCNWESNHSQQRNKSTTVRIEWNGEQVVQVDLCKVLEIRPENIPRTMARGMSRLEAIQHLVSLKERRNAKSKQNETRVSS